MKLVENKSFQYRIISLGGFSTKQDELELRNRAYSLWREVWYAVFKKVNQAEALNPDEFFRQDIAACILDRNHELVGMHLYTFFDLSARSDREHSYFAGIEDSALQKLANAGCIRLMSMEYLTVNPQWRKSLSGTAWADILVSLGQRVMQASGYDAVVGTPRTDIGVDKIGDRLGFRTYQEQITKYDYFCSLMACSKEEVKSHPDGVTREFVDQLWKDRIDTTQVTHVQTHAHSLQAVQPKSQGVQMKSATMMEIYREATAPLLQKLVESPWEDKEFYANWLSQTYYFVSNSTRLISLAGSLFPDNKLHHRFVDHAKEERNHELLLTNDLKHLGMELQSEFASTSGFYQSQVFWMFFRSPASFFGYVLCLEGIAVDYGQKAFERVQAAHGKKASNFLKVHSEEDVGHLDKAFELLEGLSPEQRQQIEQNLRQCAAMYSGILDECMKRERTILRSAA